MTARSIRRAAERKALKLARKAEISPARLAANRENALLEFATNSKDQKDPAARRSLIELHTHLVYENQHRNLHLKEARLVRRREKETAEFRRLQTERRQREQEGIGFEFSNAGADPT